VCLLRSVSRSSALAEQEIPLSLLDAAALVMLFRVLLHAKKEEEGEKKKIIYKRAVCSRLIRRISPSKVLRARRRQKSHITSALINDISLSHLHGGGKASLLLVMNLFLDHEWGLNVEAISDCRNQARRWREKS
jgi:hypothetical protein